METKHEKKLANDITDAINCFTFDNKAFCEHMCRQHRLLQEKFTQLCLDWLVTCASDDYGYDARNEYGHVIAKELCKHFCHD